MSAALLSKSSSPLIERLAHLLLLALAVTVLMAPVAGWSCLAAGLGLLLAAWPLALAEGVLGVRAQKALPEGMQVLTREADAARGWRALSWSSLGASVLAMALLALLAGVLATQALKTLAVDRFALPEGELLWPVLSVALLLLAFLRQLGKAPVLLWLLPVAALLAAIAAAQAGAGDLPVLADIARAQALPAQAGLLFGALALGGGLGVRWQLAPVAGRRLSVPAVALAVLLAALVLVGLQLSAGSLLSVLLALVVTLLAITALLQPTLAAAGAQGLSTLMALTLVLVPTVLVIESVWYFGDVDTLATLTRALAVWMAVNLLVLAVFVGWIMKVSHARKALQLPSEGLYNLWRVAVRWVAPITLLVALYPLVRGLID